MRKVIGIGETIFDIIFKNGLPTQAVPGGSTFNSMITLGRLGVPTRFITEVGNDTVGKIILDFMHKNNLSTENVDIFDDGYAQSPISLAFLDENNDARYSFYHHFPQKRLDFLWPSVEADDLVIFGSYYAVDPLLREKIQEFISYAREQNAIIYYDINFRKSHAHEAMRIMPAFIENLEYADIVRGSAEDFETLLNETDAEKLFGLLQNDVSREQLSGLSLEKWIKVINHGISFASEVCQSYENYISPEFVLRYKQEHR